MTDQGTIPVRTFTPGYRASWMRGKGKEATNPNNKTAQKIPHDLAQVRLEEARYKVNQNTKLGQLKAEMTQKRVEAAKARSKIADQIAAHNKTDVSKFTTEQITAHQKKGKELQQQRNQADRKVQDIQSQELYLVGRMQTVDADVNDFQPANNFEGKVKGFWGIANDWKQGWKGKALAVGKTIATATGLTALFLLIRSLFSGGNNPQQSPPDSLSPEMIQKLKAAMEAAYKQGVTDGAKGKPSGGLTTVDTTAQAA